MTRDSTDDDFLNAKEKLRSDSRKVRDEGVQDLLRMVESKEEKRKDCIQLLVQHIQEKGEKTRIHSHCRSEVANLVKQLAAIAAPLSCEEKKKLCNLRDLDLSIMDLREVDFSCFRLQNTVFIEAGVDGAVFEGADLSESNWDQVDVSGLDFSNVTGLTRQRIDMAYFRFDRFPLVPEGWSFPPRRRYDNEGYLWEDTFNEAQTGDAMRNGKAADFSTKRKPETQSEMEK